MRIGVCWFDDREVVGEGWASEAGQPARRINGIGDLSSSVSWVLNLGYTDFKRLSLHNSHHLRDEQYFRISLRAMADEMGLSGNAPRFVQVASEFLNRTVSLGAKYFNANLQGMGYRYMSELAGYFKFSHVRSSPVCRLGAEAIDEAAREATQENQAMMDGVRPPGSTATAFVLPRGAYYKWLLSQPVPADANWEPIFKANESLTFGNREGQDEYGTTNNRAKILALSTTHAALYKVDVNYINKSHRQFAYFGAGANTPRRWATLPEVLTMSQYAVLTLSAGFKTTLGHLGLVEKMGVEDEFSWSRGLLLENAFSALCQPINGRNGRFTSLGAYLRAYDLIALRRYAECFSKNGFVVGSYSQGRLMVYLKRGEQAHAAEFARSLGMLPPGVLGGAV